MNIPSAEFFLEASTLSTMYEDGYKEHLFPLVTDFVEHFYTADIEKFIDAHEQARLELLNNLLEAHPKIMEVLEWFNNQPATLSVFGKVTTLLLANRKPILIGRFCYKLIYFYMLETETLPDKLEKLKRTLDDIPQDEITEEDRINTCHFWYSRDMYIDGLIKSKKIEPTLQTLNDYQERFKQKNINLKKKIFLDNPFPYKYQLMRLGIERSINFRFVSFISELARMANWYITDAYLERATVSKDRIDKIINLLSSLHDEVDLMLASKWCPNTFTRPLILPRLDCKSNQRASIRILEGMKKEELSITKRKDQTIQERLMIIDLIRSHRKLYQHDMDKRDIFKLMELPFIENLVEMKTIERIIATEKANQKEMLQEKSRTAQ